MTSTTWRLSCVLWLAACGDAGSVGPASGADGGDPDGGSQAPARCESVGCKPGEPSRPIGPPDPDGNGQTGSPGAAQCVADEDCATLALAGLEAFSGPAAEPAPVESSRCEHANVIVDSGSVRGPSCLCETADGGSRMLGPEGLGCYVFGRSGDCLFGDDDFEGCDVGDAGSCEVACATLAARRSEDAAHTFEVELVSASCTDLWCENVVRLDDRCHVNDSYQRGLSYDCALGVDAIVAQYRADVAPAMPDPLPPSSTPSPYVEGNDGFVDVTVVQDFYAGHATPPYFGGFAQFFEVSGSGQSFGEVVDPLDGLDDCGRVSMAGIGTSGSVEFLRVEQLALVDEDRELPFELTSASHATFASYGLDLTALEVEPRFLGRYGLRGGGGTFGERFDVELTLPAALHVTSLEDVARVERGELSLRWSGTGDAPLHVLLWLQAGLGDAAPLVRVDCVLQDDGEHVLPAEVLAGVPDGFVAAEFTRARRSSAPAGDKRVQITAAVQARHNFALGPACDAADALAACERHFEALTDVYAQCGVSELPRLEQICPAYLAESCEACPEYFACLTETTRCTAGGIEVASSGCACPR